MSGDDDELLRENYELAKNVVEWAQVLFRRMAPERAVGITVLVHDVEAPAEALLEWGQKRIAVSTTLRSAREQRVLLTEAIYRSLMNEGASAEDVADIAARDMEEADARARRNKH